MIPNTARRIVRGVEKEVPVNEITPDQLVLVKPEEYFPVDGIITEGATTVDEKLITGFEAVEKFPSSRVYAGTKNNASKVIVRTTATADNTLLSRIQIFMQRQQDTPKPKKGLFAKFLRKPDTNHETLKILSQQGIFVASEQILDKLRKVDTIVFDKTGIITTGAKHVVHVVSFKPYTQQQVLNITAAIESHSAHLTAKSIVSFARLHGAVALQPVEEFKEELGIGVSGKINGKTVVVGPAALFQKKKIRIPKEAFSHKEEGETVIYIAMDKEILGYIALNNPVKKNAKEILQTLKQHRRVVMLTGEHEETAAAIAKQVAMNEVIADVRASKREDEIVALQKKGRSVAYVTAINSTRKADVTITMGTRAAFSGDVTILHGDLEAIKTLFEALNK
jgi:cation transport ATPase